MGSTLVASISCISDASRVSITGIPHRYPNLEFPGLTFKFHLPSAIVVRVAFMGVRMGCYRDGRGIRTFALNVVFLRECIHHVGRSGRKSRS